MFNNLHELISKMPDHDTCRAYLEQQRWDGKPVCTYCGYSEKIYSIEGGKRYKCGSKECNKKFTVTMGTIFEASNIKLNKWFMAIYLCTAHKKGISSYQLGRDIGVTQKSAWFMLHRIREMMKPLETKMGNIVEVDETYVGGKLGNMRKSKRKYLRDNDLVSKSKTGVMGILERGGELRYVQIGQNTDAYTMQTVVKDNVDTSATLVTDSHASYIGLKHHYAAHESVNHSNEEYVRGMYNTNSIEGAFSLLKRGIIGIYHQVTPKHLIRYCNEFSYRYNTRKIKDADRFTSSLQAISKRLTYKQLIAPLPETAERLDAKQINYISTLATNECRYEEETDEERYFDNLDKIANEFNEQIRKGNTPQ